MSEKPGEHPEPHPGLAHRDPLIFSLRTGSKIYRLYPAGRDPLHFGRSGDNRFDAPDSSFGVLYAGADEYCCFIETCGQLSATPVVTRAGLDRLHLAEINVVTELRLIDLASTGGLARIGADARLMSGSHSLAQRWSAALRHHPSRPDGIRYLSRHDPARFAVAMYDCPAETFAINDRGALTAPGNLSLLGQILELYKVSLIEP